MKLIDLGFDSWFDEKMGEIPDSECRVARVTAVNRDSFMVRNETTEVFAEATGKLLYSAESGIDLPCVGDWVYAHYFNNETLAIIHAVFPRKSFLRRKAAGRRIEYQMIASNIDCALIIQACDFDFNISRLDRYLSMVHDGGIEPLVLLSKSDLISPEILEKKLEEIRSSGIRCRIVPFSNTTGAGHDQLKALLNPQKTYCLIGSSGVGKSTLLNQLLNQTLLETREVRAHDGRGRHATTRRQLIVLPNGAMMIDTPGLRELATIGGTAGIEESFSDIMEHSRTCHFSDCTHTNEIGCSILGALKSGNLSQERYQNFLKLTKEAEFHQLSYVEKRQKDKKFGKSIKATLKLLKKNRD